MEIDQVNKYTQMFQLNEPERLDYYLLTISTSSMKGMRTAYLLLDCYLFTVAVHS
jgi:hypothetical protein